MQRQVWKENIKIKPEAEENKNNEINKYEMGSNPFDADYMLFIQEQNAKRREEKEKSEGR